MTIREDKKTTFIFKKALLLSRIYCIRYVTGKRWLNFIYSAAFLNILLKYILPIMGL